MLKIINQFLDLIFPPRQSELHVRDAQAQDFTSLYRPDRYQNVHFLTSYKNVLVEALIKENKYHESPQARKALAELLAIWLKAHPAKRLVLVPIPQSKERARERGHNQVESILSQTKLPEHVTINTRLIQKSKHTPTQTSLSREERLKNVQDSLSLTKDAKLEGLMGATIIIVDDVVTTGATMEAARASLTPHLPEGATVILLAIAH